VSIFCPSCQRHTAHRALFEKNGCIIRRCNNCGLGQAEARDFQPEKYYVDDYFNGGHADGYADYAGSENVLRAEFARVVDVLKLHCNAGGRLLEIGCAYGFFLKEAQKSFEVHGIELATAAVEACHLAGLENVHQGVADEKNLARIGQVDVVVMLDVIEHLPDPFETIRLCTKLLKPGGIMLITTGDFGSPVARLTGRSWRLMTPPQHLWFFTRKSFLNMASSLELDMASYTHPRKIVPVSLILFQLARVAGVNLTASSLKHLNRLGVPVNLFDAARVVLRKPLSQE
jgi:2-polyprenyl-3-methyl-5-hydroxy-6-metoxy-1,4-benzoquinol methylase